MKHTIPFILVILISVAWSSCKTSNGKNSAGDASIVFDTLAHNFGEIPFNGEGDFEFVFRNQGNSPLILTHVKSTCGCTIPQWSDEPIEAGKQGSIKVSYDTHRVGPFTKSIYVYSNAGNGVQKLIITGKVKPLG